MNGVTVKSIYEISFEDAATVSTWINEENKLKKHMLEKDPTDLINQINNFGGVIAKTINNEICGFMCLNKTKLQLIEGLTLFERGSLIVDANFRGMGLGNLLRNKLLDENQDKGIFTVSNVPLVIKSNKKIGQHQLTQNLLKQVSPILYETIEFEGKLLEDDVVFVNEKIKTHISLF